ncbi:MAG: DUF4336 domain-containing protein [Prochloraceae cyanobacterium]|nr:DUF4336 domain-containing protein [Prochloraceae cyanobacterium]
MKDLYEYQKDKIWIKEYPIHYAGVDFNSRMTVIRLSNGNLFIHSPCEIDENTKVAIESLGKVEFIVAPGSYHYFYVESAQRAFPHAETFICPGIEIKKPDIEFDWLLGDRPDKRWENDFEQVLIRGNRCIWEVAFYHQVTRTLILVDLIENITDETEDVSGTLKLWWQLVFRMWNNPKPAPEYQLGWKDKKAASKSLKRILTWDFERIIIAHGDLIEENAKEVALHAWQQVLASSENA